LKYGSSLDNLAVVETRMSDSRVPMPVNREPGIRHKSTVVDKETFGIN